MRKQIYAISLLLSFLVMLSHQVISHHHHDTSAYDYTASLNKADEHEHHDALHHHHDSQEKSDDEKDSHNKHNHPFPLHQHVSATNDFDCTRTNPQQTNSNDQSIKIFGSSSLFHKQYIEPPKLTKLSFEEPPFLITSLFEPGAFALRGPPSIV